MKKFRFIQLYHEIRDKVFNKKYIDIAWKDTGLVPFNPSILYNKYGGAPQNHQVIRDNTPPSLPAPIQSSSPGDVHLTPSEKMTTPTTIPQLQHFNARYQELLSFSFLDESPSRERHEKIYKAAETAIIKSNIWKQRYEDLSKVNGKAVTKRSDRQRLPDFGRVLTAENLDRVDLERFLDGEVTTDEEDELTDWGGHRGLTFAIQVSRPYTAPTVSEETLQKGFTACKKWFHGIKKKTT